MSTIFAKSSIIDVSQDSKYNFGIQFSIQFTMELQSSNKTSQWKTAILRLYGYTSDGQTSAEIDLFFWPNMFIHKHGGLADEIPSLNKYEVTMGPWF